MDLMEQYNLRLQYQAGGLPEGYDLQRGEDGSTAWAAPEPTDVEKANLQEMGIDVDDPNAPALTNYEPTMRENARFVVTEGLMDAGMDLHEARDWSERIMGNETSLADMGIGIADLVGVGEVMGIEEGLRQFDRGYQSGDAMDMGMGALFSVLNAAGLRPAVQGILKSGPVQDMIAEGGARWDQGKSPIPVGMSIEDVSDSVTGGVPFAPEITEKNLRLHRKRLVDLQEGGKPYPGAPKNQRRVITAPEGSDLPDFVVGDITPEDWVSRTERLMSPEDIEKSAKWYDQVFGDFLDKVDGDREKAGRLMGAWLAAQQNESPANAMTNVLYMWEQMGRGVPLNEVKGKGLPSANKAALSVLSGEDIQGGVGQKISDFIDAGEGRDVRSIMGNNPEGGQPFVVDVHTARDTGLVDETLLNHLKGLGYDVPDDVIVDLGAGGIKGPMYENRALFGQRLTDHLNEVQWQGRSDWKPREVQAIGWMGLTRMYGNSSVGGDVASSFGRNVRRISMEAAPGDGSPAAIKYGDAFAGLPSERQRDISYKVTQSAIDRVNERLGLNIGNVVHATGGWQRFTNPSTVQQAIASRESAQEAANMLGYMLQQTEVWVNSAKAMTKNPKGYAIDLVEIGSTTIKGDNELAELWEAVLDVDASGLIQGYQPITDASGNVGIRILVDRGGKKAAQAIQEWHRSFSDVSDRFSYNIDVEVSEAEIFKARNDWKENPDGQGFRNQVDHSGRGSSSAKDGSDLDLDRQELEDFFGRLIEGGEE